MFTEAVGAELPEVGGMVRPQAGEAINAVPKVASAAFVVLRSTPSGELIMASLPAAPTALPLIFSPTHLQIVN
jgi:hypothetical protein